MMSSSLPSRAALLLSLLLVSSVVVATSATSSSSPFGLSTSNHGRGFASIPSNIAGGAVQILSSSKHHANDEDEDVAKPLSQFSKVDITGREAPLLADIELLSNILGELVYNEDPETYELYKEFRKYGLDRANDVTNTDALEKMIQRASEMTADQAVGVTRSFSIMLNLVNSAEVHHRQRVTRQHAKNQTISGSDTTVGPLPLSEDSMRGTIKELLKQGQATPEQILQQLCQQKVEIVLTAHPTQVQRKSLLRKYRKISETLALSERPDLDVYEKQAANSDLRRIVSSIWGADEIRRNKPTPQQEAAGGNAIIESVLWDAVPSYLRKLHTQCELQLGVKLPVDVAPIKFASWIGGDRDGAFLQYSIRY